MSILCESYMNFESCVYTTWKFWEKMKIIHFEYISLLLQLYMEDKIFMLLYNLLLNSVESFHKVISFAFSYFSLLFLFLFFFLLLLLLSGTKSHLNSENVVF